MTTVTIANPSIRIRQLNDDSQIVPILRNCNLWTWDDIKG